MKAKTPKRIRVFCPACGLTAYISPSAPKWADNAVQFPRLLAEINAVGLTNQQVLDLCCSMNLEWLEIKELFGRAEREWEKIKRLSMKQGVKRRKRGG